MQTYRVFITGTYHVSVEIEAASRDEAEDLVYINYDKSMLEELVAEQGVDKILNVSAERPKEVLAQEHLPIPATIFYADINYKSEYTSRYSLMRALKKSGFFSSMSNDIQTKEIQAMQSGHTWLDKTGKPNTITF